MKINRASALHLWEERYGDQRFAVDFHGSLMCREAYGDPNYYVIDRNAGRFNLPTRIYCGWNIHHILPVAHGGTNARENLLCTNIATNEAAEDKITFWIDDCLYQVKRTPGSSEHEIVRID